MKNSLSILETLSPEEKSLICNRILNALPDWFGNSEAIADYTEKVRNWPFFACKDDEKSVGFIAVKQEDDTAEIAVMGVLPEYHRQGIGRELIATCEKHCSSNNIRTLTVKTVADTVQYVGYAKTRAFYSAMGFLPQMVLPDFWDKANPCLCMVKPLDSQALNAVIMQNEYIEFVYEIKHSDHNKAALHGDNMTLDEWDQVCKKNLQDPDEANFIIRMGVVPVAWLKVNGLQGDGTAWISMLIVHEKFQHQGIGSYAVRLAEDFARLRGFKGVGIHTNVDNISAQNCYKKLGYTITEENECTNGDGQKRRGLTFYRDRLDAVRMCVDGVSFHIGKLHDFSFLSKIGKVFRVFCNMDSGNICFGVERDNKRYFVKYAGARTMYYNGEIADAVARLKTAVKVYDDLQHPYLIRLVEHYPVGDGYVAVFDWVNGEGLRSYWDYVGQAMWQHPQSPNYRFRRLPIEKRIAVVDKIFDFHQHVIERGYVPVDFYDGSLLYDFDTDDFHICDIDFYRRMPAVNDMGKLWGSDRFIAPEERELGATLDEVKTVYNMGAAAFELLCVTSKSAYEIDRSFEAWSASKALFDVAAKAVSDDRSQRYQTMAELIAAWDQAKAVTDIQYRQLGIEDISPDMLTYFNRYQVVTKSWRKHGNEYVLEDTPFIDDWSEEKKHRTVTVGFPEAIRSGGCVFGAFDAEKLIGFAVIPGDFIGKEKQYLQLDNMQVSYEYRHKGMGRKLFLLCAEAGKALGAQKLYISAQSSQESQAFYRAMGCVNAEEIIPELFEQEPFDVHMEYVL